MGQSGFYVSATAVFEKWKVTNPVFPPWTSVVASRELEVCLSLQVFFCPRCIEGNIGGESSDKEEVICATEEEPVDDATLVYVSVRSGSNVQCYDRELYLL